MGCKGEVDRESNQTSVFLSDVGKRQEITPHLLLISDAAFTSFRDPTQAGMHERVKNTISPPLANVPEISTIPTAGPWLLSGLTYSYSTKQPYSLIV
jgi:hypothetical protein